MIVLPLTVMIMGLLSTASSLSCNCNLTAPTGDLAKTFKETGMAKSEAEAQQMLTEMQCANGLCAMREASSTAPLQPVCVLTQIWNEDRSTSQMMAMCTYFPSIPNNRIQKESCMDNTVGNQLGATKMRFCTTDKCNNKIDCSKNGAAIGQVAISLLLFCVVVGLSSLP